MAQSLILALENCTAALRRLKGFLNNRRVHGATSYLRISFELLFFFKTEIFIKFQHRIPS